MLPILISHGDFVLPAWHTFYALGSLLAFVYLIKLTKLIAPEVSNSDINNLFSICYVTGYLGARILSIATEEPEISDLNAFIEALLKFGSMTFYGGAIAAFASGLVFAKARNLSILSLCDIGIPPGLLALAIGRIGCFLNGDDFGRPVPLDSSGDAPIWAITFPNLGDHVARYPIQLVESAFAALIAGSLGYYCRPLRHRFGPGMVGLLGIISYAIGRFCFEFYRGDERGVVFGTWLSTSQFISVLILSLCLIGASNRWFRKERQN